MEALSLALSRVNPLCVELCAETIFFDEQQCLHLGLTDRSFANIIGGYWPVADISVLTYMFSDMHQY